MQKDTRAEGAKLRPGFLREMKRGEEAAVDALLHTAFGRKTEAQLIAQLRKSGAIAGESVLPLGRGVAGYFALSMMVKPKGWLCLAPVAIAPEWQGQGFGRRMLGMLSGWAGASSATIVVLGDPAYYERCGFSQARAARLSSPYPIAHTLLMAPGQDIPEAELVYPRAFG